MIESLIRASLQQRVVLAVVALALCAFGIRAVQTLSVDAFPDVTNVQVQIARSPPRRPGARPRRWSASSPCRSRSA